MNYLELLQLASPEAIVVLTVLVVLTIGLARPGAGDAASAVAVLGLVLAAGAVAFVLPNEAFLANGMLVVSPLNSLFKIICLVLAVFTVVLARGSDFTPHHAEYVGMILLGTLGLLLLVGSEELLMIFIGLELTGLSLYVMTAFDRRSRSSAEAGLKYFLFGSVASAFTLFGLSLIYGMTSATGLMAIGEQIAAGPVPPLLAAGIAMTLVGLAFKIAAAPFHLWAPEAYHGAPIPSAAFIASGSKVASFVVLGKIVLLGFAFASGSAAWGAFAAGWVPLLAVLAALSIIIGNLAALAQTNVRRLLAYSAVAHAGYTLLGLIAGEREGFTATLFYSTTYAFTLLGVFGVVAFVRRATGGDDFAHFATLRTRSPLLAGSMAVFMLSLAGLPPLAGFFGKFYLFAAALRADENQGLLWLVVVALLGSLVSLYYYLLVLKVIFVDGPVAPVAQDFRGAASTPVDPLQRVTVAILAAIVLGLGIVPGTLLNRIAASLP
ncbi:NADH-quinone oxidoreductase subunit N [soil metagenome]